MKMQRLAVFALIISCTGLELACSSSDKKKPTAASDASVEEIVISQGHRKAAPSPVAAPAVMMQRERWAAPPPPNRENYQKQTENPVKSTQSEPVSTFSIDVDTGSYSNVRRMLKQGQLPPKDAVRIEEMINYFPYAKAAKTTEHPFTVQTELAPAPWNTEHQLLRLRIQAVEAKAAEMPPCNLVFLVDVSGSMNEPDKLPLVKSSLKMLAKKLRAEDRISLVVYAGRTQVELEPIPGNQHEKILAAIDRLQAGGSTAGEAAMKLAYQMARSSYIKGGINRILMATDGDFNVGLSGVDQLKDMVAAERKSGVSLSTLGFGTGNYNDYMMEQVADAGNGNHAYIDSVDEARKVLLEEMGSTFNTVAADVKVQVEFNPAQVAEYRLLGYENRLLNEADFNNDKVDAGEIGAGKTVTALYEITPVGKATLIDPHRYQTTAAAKPATDLGKELAFLRLRYKQPGKDTSILMQEPIPVSSAKDSLDQTSPDFRFAASVAGFGMSLRDSHYLGSYNLDKLIELAKSGLGSDDEGYRNEFVRLMKTARELQPKTLTAQ